MQLDQLTVVRRAGDGEAAPAPVVEQHVEILARLELQRLHRRQLEEHLHHIRRETLQARDPARQRLDLDIRDVGDQPRLDAEIRSRQRLAHQDVPRPRLLGREAERLPVRIVNLARDRAARGTSRSAPTCSCAGG